jgi:hypothetical protein
VAAAKAGVEAPPVCILIVGDGLGDDPFEFEDPDDAYPQPIVALALPPPDDVPAPISAAAVLMPNLPPPLPSVYLNLPGFPDIHAIFDHISHESGNRRAMLYCSEHGPRCRLYVYIKDFRSKEHACAYLFALHLSGVDIHDPDLVRAAEHIDAKPSVESVEAIMQMRFG